MIKRIGRYLDLEGESLQQLAQIAALIILALIGLLIVSLAFGIAVRVFTCTGGISC